MQLDTAFTFVSLNILMYEQTNSELTVWQSIFGRKQKSPHLLLSYNLKRACLLPVGGKQQLDTALIVRSFNTLTYKQKDVQSFHLCRYSQHTTETEKYPSQQSSECYVGKLEEACTTDAKTTLMVCSPNQVTKWQLWSPAQCILVTQLIRSQQTTVRVQHNLLPRIVHSQNNKPSRGTQSFARESLPQSQTVFLSTSIEFRPTM